MSSRHIMFTLLIFHWLKVSANTNNLFDNALKKDEGITECLLNIISETVQPGEAIAFIRDTTQDYLFNKLNKILQAKISYVIYHNTVFELETDIPKSQDVDIIILQITDTEQLNSLLASMKFSNIFNSHKKLLVTFTSTFKNASAIISHTLEILWSFDVYNIIIVLPNKQNVKVYTWHPYDNNSCGNNYTNFKIIRQCVKGKLHRGKLLYASKIPRALPKCLVRVRTVVWPPFILQPTKKILNTNGYIFKNGFEIVLMNTIARAINLNLTYTVSEKDLNWGELHANGTATGMQAYVLEKEADVGISSQAYTETRLKFFDMGEPYFFEHLVWCVPHADTIPVWKKIVNVFSFAFWVLNLTVYLIFVLTVWVFSKFNSFERKRFGYLFNSVESAFGVLLGVTIFQVPRSSFVRALFSLWFVFTLHLGIVYKTTLISQLTSPVYQYQINTVEEILESNTRLQFLSPMKRYFLENQDHSKEILRKWIDCIDLTDCMDRVAYTGDSVILLPQLYLEFVKGRYKRKNRGSYIHCFNGNILTYPGSIIMRKGFPLRDIFNAYIRRITAAGLMDFWIKTSLKNFQSNKTVTFDDVGNKLIALKELQPAFVCLMVGVVLAVVALFVEIFLYRCWFKTQVYTFLN